MDEGVDFVLVGGLAVASYGSDRSTVDLDTWVLGLHHRLLALGYVEERYVIDVAEVT